MIPLAMPYMHNATYLYSAPISKTNGSLYSNISNLEINDTDAIAVTNTSMRPAIVNTNYTNGISDDDVASISSFGLQFAELATTIRYVNTTVSDDDTAAITDFGLHAAVLLDSIRYVNNTISDDDAVSITNAVLLSAEMPTVVNYIDVSIEEPDELAVTNFILLSGEMT